MKEIDITYLEEKYTIHENGNIFRTKTGWKMRGTVSNVGYERVTLRGDRYSRHRVIAMKFLPKEAWRQYINHKDGNKLNNNSSNLEWCTMSENTYHAFNTGLRVPRWGTTDGEKSHLAVLKADQVIAIRKEQGLSQREIAEKYNVSKSAIKHVLKNRTWKHLLDKESA